MFCFFLSTWTNHYNFPSDTWPSLRRIYNHDTVGHKTRIDLASWRTMHWRIPKIILINQKTLLKAGMNIWSWFNWLCSLLQTEVSWLADSTKKKYRLATRPHAHPIQYVRITELNLYISFNAWNDLDFIQTLTKKIIKIWIHLIRFAHFPRTVWRPKRKNTHKFLWVKKKGTQGFTMSANLPIYTRSPTMHQQSFRSAW